MAILSLSDITFGGNSAFSPGSGATRSTAILDFGAFPGKSDASIVITGQAAVTGSTIPKCWLIPVATTDHTADEHMIETINVFAGNVVAGTGFTIYGFNRAQMNDTRIYGKFTVAWEY